MKRLVVQRDSITKMIGELTGIYVKISGAFGIAKRDYNQSNGTEKLKQRKNGEVIFNFKQQVDWVFIRNCKHLIIFEG